MTPVIGSISAEQWLLIQPTSVSAFHRRLFSYEDEFNKRGIGKIYMLFAGWEGRIVKNCDRGLENAARGRRPRAAFSSPRSQFFTIRTDPKPANNLFIFFLRLIIYMKKLLDSDWLRAVQFKCNTSAKSVTPVQKV